MMICSNALLQWNEVLLQGIENCVAYETWKAIISLYLAQSKPLMVFNRDLGKLKIV